MQIFSGPANFILLDDSVQQGFQNKDLSFKIDPKMLRY